MVLFKLQSSGSDPDIQEVHIDHSYDPVLIEYHHNKVKEDIRKSKAAIVNITCPDLNNHTFTNEPPFDILGLPQCGDKIAPQLKLYLDDDNKTECFLEPRNLPNANTTQCLQKLKEHQETKKVVVVTHGFLNSFGTNWLHVMKDAIQSVENGTAVIVSTLFCHL